MPWESQIGCLKVGKGAYFVPSYSEQTVVLYDPLLSSQTVLVEAGEEEDAGISVIEPEYDLGRKDFEKALRKVSRKAKR